jgi:glutamate-1-semialdehyde 2,1-aminomutase
MKQIGAIDIMERMGQRLRDGIEAQARMHGIRLAQSGPPQMPVILFADDQDCTKGWLFCQQALRRGVYLHALHTNFLSAAHTSDDIDRALEATDAAMATVARHHGAD